MNQITANKIRIIFLYGIVWAFMEYLFSPLLRAINRVVPESIRNSAEYAETYVDLHSIESSDQIIISIIITIALWIGSVIYSHQRVRRNYEAQRAQQNDQL